MKLERLWTEPPAFERRVPTVSDRQLRSSSRILGSTCGRPASFSTYRISGSPSSSNGPGEARVSNRQTAGPQAGGLHVSWDGGRVKDSSPPSTRGFMNTAGAIPCTPLFRVYRRLSDLPLGSFVCGNSQAKRGSLHTRS